MTASVRIEYFELLDHWSWEATVNTHSAYGVEQTYEDAIAWAKDELRRMMEEEADV